MSPDGVKIAGEKVDIYGVVTVHNSDGTGSTTITGPTISTGTINSSEINSSTINSTTITGCTITSTGNMKWQYSGTSSGTSYSGEIEAAAGQVSTNLTANGVSYKYGLVFRGKYSSMGTTVLTGGSENTDVIGFDSYNFVATGRNVYITGQYNNSANAAGIAIEQTDNSNIKMIMMARYGSTAEARMDIASTFIGMRWTSGTWINCDAIVRMDLDDFQRLGIVARCKARSGSWSDSARVVMPCTMNTSNYPSF
jgi:hypothetical protein